METLEGHRATSTGAHAGCSAQHSLYGHDVDAPDCAQIGDFRIVDVWMDEWIYRSSGGLSFDDEFTTASGS